MAAFVIDSNPFEYTEAEAVPVENTLDTSFIPSQSGYQYPRRFDPTIKARRVKIQVTVGTFQFSVGAAIAGNSPAITTTDDAVDLTVVDDALIYFKATTQADKLFISG